MRARLAAAAALALVLAGCATPADIQRFRDTCASVGGFVAQTDSTWLTKRIDCIVDGRVVYLPGFA